MTKAKEKRSVVVETDHGVTSNAATCPAPRTTIPEGETRGVPQGIELR